MTSAYAVQTHMHPFFANVHHSSMPPPEDNVAQNDFSEDSVLARTSLEHDTRHNHSPGLSIAADANNEGESAAGRSAHINQFTDRLESVQISDPNHARRKSRKVEDPTQETIRHWCGLGDEHTDNNLEPTEMQTGPSAHPHPSFENVDSTQISVSPDNPAGGGNMALTSSSDLHAHAVPAESTEIQRLPSRKVLKLNGHGGFGSPKKPPAEKDNEGNPSIASQDTPKTRRRGRPRKRFIIKIPYGSSDLARKDEIGRKIQGILDSDSKHEPPSTKKPVMTQALNPQKPTHPFFSSKSGSNPAVGNETENQLNTPTALSSSITKSTRAFTTPVKLPAQNDVFGAETKNLVGTSIGFGLTQRHSTSTALFWPPWPYQGFTRVEPDSTFIETHNVQPNPAPYEHGFRARRRKAKAEVIKQEESVVQVCRVKLDRLRDGAKGLPIADKSPRTVRLPSRLLVSSHFIQKEAMVAINSLSASSTDCQAPGSSSSGLRIQNAAVRRMYGRIGQTLSSFDSGKCESKAWTEKYAPKKASDVLQSPIETSLLRDWLVKLKVDAVETRSRSSMPSAGVTTGTKKRKRGRKAASELDDFIVSGSDDENELGALSEVPSSSNEEYATKVAPSLVRENVIKDGKPVKAMNAVLLSGPHGCGKTAAAYAVANELGFDVFEINSSSRRTGRDILDKIGDMTVNHQVRQTSGIESKSHSEGGHQDSPPFPQDEKQCSLNAFFKSNQQSKIKLPKVGSSAVEAAKKAIDKSSKSQRQALILLEEVDVLFEEDKQFWDTIDELTQHSRRPIVMTCNNEKLIPLNELNLHAVLRFGAPDPGLASAYLLALAACENHLLDAVAVKDLYESTNRDLRNSIVSLNFWCQMGVGDAKGGLEWSLSRWPPVSDVDADGQQIHVVSKDTFATQSALLIPHARLSEQDPVLDESDLVMQAWQEWQIPTSEYSSHIFEDMSSEACLSSLSFATKLENIKSLQDYDRLLNSRSEVDVFCCVDISCISTISTTTSTPPHARLDLSLPSISDTQRAQFPEGAALVEATPRRDYSNLDSLIASTTHLAISDRHGEICSDRPEQRGHVNDKTVNVETRLIAKILRRAQQKQENALITSSASVSRACSQIVDEAHARAYPRALIKDVAPYVRLIAAHDRAVEEARTVLDGPLAKRRRTRVSRSAAEGSVRSDTRRESWFGEDVDLELVLATGGRDWRGRADPKNAAIYNARETDDEFPEVDVDMKSG